MESLRKSDATLTWFVAFCLVICFAQATHSQGFTPQPTQFPGVYASSVAWGDYNNDGLLDVVILGSGDSAGSQTQDLHKNVTKIFRNNGDGTFTEDSLALLMPVSIGTVAWGDYDNDGLLDLLYGGVDTLNNQVTKLYHNNGDGTFTLNTQTGFHSSSYGYVAWGDYNNDGYLDILLTGVDLGPAQQATKLYRNNHDGSFTEVTTAGFQGVNGHSRICFGDYDNDGYQDVLFCGRTTRDWLNPQSVTKLYHNNRGNGTFTEDTAAHLVPLAHGPAFFGDFNNDGYLDIVVSGVVGPADGPPGFVLTDTTVIYLNNGGNGTFTAVPSHPLLPGAYQGMAAIGDYDADGKLDLLLNGYGTSPGLFRGQGDGTFVPQSLGTPALAFGGVAWGDFNGDGMLDALISGTLVGVSIDSTILARNSGAGTSIDFALNVPPNAPTGLTTLVTGGSVRLSWNRATDSKTPPAGLSYAVRVGTTTGGVDVVSPLSGSDGKRRVAALGGQNLITDWTLRDLSPGLYYWSVQAIDNSYAGSAFASEGTFTIPPPTASITPRTLSFGHVALPNSKVDSLRVINTGGGTLRVVRKSVSDAAFSVAPDSVTVASGDSARFYVTFNPARADTFSATLAFSTGDTIGLTGRGTGNGIAVYTPRSLDFGPVQFNQLKQDSIGVRNIGNAQLTIIRKDVADPAFAAAPDTVVLAPGDSARIHASFRPANTGPASTNLIFTSNSEVNDTLGLSGTGTVMTLASVRKTAAGSAVSFLGVVTRAKGSYTYLQDTSAGIALYQPTGAYHDSLRNGFIAPGDRLLISGRTSQSASMLEIPASGLGGWLRVARGDTSAKPATVTLSHLKTGGEKYESMLVKVVQLQLVGNADTLFKPGKIYNVKDPGDTSKAVALWIPNAGDSDLDSTKISVTKQYRKGWVFTFNGVLGQFSSRDSTKGYQLTAINAGDVHFDSLTTGVPEGSLSGEGAVPTVYSLSQNYPNPFNPSTTIAFALPKASTVELKVYTMLGQEVATLVHETMSAGRHTVSFNAGNLASGLYFYRITSGDFSSVRKMMLVK